MAVRYVCVSGGMSVDRFLAVRYLCVTGGVSVHGLISGCAVRVCNW